MKTFPTIYKRTSTGAIQQWTIIANGGQYHTEEGVVNGTISVNSPHTCQAKNIGRANESTAEEQAETEAKSKWDKKLKTGYALSIGAIDDVAFQKPMKGYKWKEYADKVKFPVDIQDKLNGIRCQNEADEARSTGGEIFYTIPHIRNELAPLFKEYPNLFLDGEAFNFTLKKHLNRLTELVSVVIKEKDLTPELLAESKKIVQLHVFDAYGFDNITENTPWRERHAALKKLLSKFNLNHVFLLDYTTVNSLPELLKKLEENRLAGGEGLMVRWGECPRKNGKSKYMLKMKHFEDDEFKISDIEEGNGNWAGCAKAIICELPSPNQRGDTTFRSNIEGDEAWLRQLLKDKDTLKGEMATVEYQQLSEYGIPQLPFVRAIRNYESSTKKK
jgi:DNA ligase 1